MDFDSLLRRYDLNEYILFNPRDIKIDKSVRAMCEQNSCGSYGKNYMCPPYVKDIDDCEKEIYSFDNAILLTKVYPKESSFDLEGLMEAAIDFGETIQKMKEDLSVQLPEKTFLFLGAGGCPVCKKCACIDDEPCRFPDTAISSVEANGIEVIQLCRDLGIKYNNGQNTVTYMGMILFNS